jgi:hypothetical protein
MVPEAVHPPDGTPAYERDEGPESAYHIECFPKPRLELNKERS